MGLNPLKRTISCGKADPHVRYDWKHGEWMSREKKLLDEKTLPQHYLTIQLMKVFFFRFSCRKIRILIGYLSVRFIPSVAFFAREKKNPTFPQLVPSSVGGVGAWRSIGRGKGHQAPRRRTGGGMLQAERGGAYFQPEKAVVIFGFFRGMGDGDGNDLYTFF